MSDHDHPWTQEQSESAIAATIDLKMTTAVTRPTFRIHPTVIAQAAAGDVTKALIEAQLRGL